jgi:hypothetical protein
MESSFVVMARINTDKCPRGLLVFVDQISIYIRSQCRKRSFVFSINELGNFRSIYQDFNLNWTVRYFVLDLWAIYNKFSVFSEAKSIPRKYLV